MIGYPIGTRCVVTFMPSWAPNSSVRPGDIVTCEERGFIWWAGSTTTMFGRPCLMNPNQSRLNGHGCQPITMVHTDKIEVLPVAWMRPIDADMDSDDAEIIRALFTPRVPEHQP